MGLMSDRGKVNLRVASELVGATAVLLGLVFVGLELRQNTAALSAQAVFELNTSANEMHLMLAQDESLESLIDRGLEDPDSLSESERRRFVRYMRARFNAAEAAWMYQDKGLLTEGEYVGYIGSVCATLSRRGARWFWESGFGSYAYGFVQDVEAECS